MSDAPETTPPAEWPELARFKAEFRKFVAEHDWDQFHSPKNLAMALNGEKYPAEQVRGSARKYTAYDSKTASE